MDNDIFQQIANIANSNVKLNQGRVFSRNSVITFLSTTDTTIPFFHAGWVQAILTVTYDGEVGFVVNPKCFRQVYKEVISALNNLPHKKLWCIVQNDNPSFQKVLIRNKFEVVDRTSQNIYLRRNRGDTPDEST